MPSSICLHVIEIVFILFIFKTIYRDLDRKSDNAYILKELRKRRYHKRKSIIRREDERKRVYRNFVGHMRHILRHAREGSEVPEDHKIHIIGRKRHGPKK